MSDGPTGREQSTGWYEIRLQGHLHSRWAAWFDGLTVSTEEDGTTRLHGPVVDQAALHGLLQKLRDLGVPLLSVTQVEPNELEAKTAIPQAKGPHLP